MGKRKMDRREFVAAMGVASAAAQGLTGCATAGSAKGEGARKNARPNILFIVSDQHRADCLGCYGGPDVRTPNLDALASEGTRFAECFCPYPVCTPSRYSMLSGMYVHEHNGSNNRCTLRSDIATFPKILRMAGYNTAAVGKMHFTPTYLDVGFDRMVLSEQDGDGRWDDDFHRELMQHGLVDVNDIEDQRREFRANARQAYWDTCGAIESNLPLEFHPTEWTGRKALEMIDGWGAEGNLLMVSFIKPHHPFDPPASYADRYDPARLEMPAGWTPSCFDHDLAIHPGYFKHESLTEPLLKHIAAYYYANIEHIDEQVGRMIALLKRKGMYDNTLIVYTSDHGEYLGYHHLLLKGNYLYDALARVPLIVKWPGETRPGVSRDLVSLVDLPTTFVRQAGCAPVPTMAGNDLKTGAGHETIFSESFRGDQVMVRTRSHKLLLSRSSQASHKSLFFDLDADPFEQDDRFDDGTERDRIAAMTEAAVAWQGTHPLPEAHLDFKAPQIQQPNVPPQDSSHREAIVTYYHQAMEKAGIPAKV